MGKINTKFGVVIIRTLSDFALITLLWNFNLPMFHLFFLAVSEWGGCRQYILRNAIYDPFCLFFFLFLNQRNIGN